MATQKQAVMTNAMKTKIGKTQAESKCRLCSEVDEIARQCLNALCLHKRKHGRVSRKIH